MVEVDLYKIEVDLSQRSKKSAEEIYERLRELPENVKRNLQSFIDNLPLTRKLEGRFVSSEGSD